MRYMTCGRNFNEKICQKDSFTSLLNELKNKIISLLFDNRGEFLSHSASQTGLSINSSALLEQINAYYKHKHEEQQSKNETPSYSNRKQSTDTVNQEDSTLICEEDIKPKINITPLNEENILLFLTKIIPLLDLPFPNEQTPTTQILISYIISTASSSNATSITKHPHLRKHICMKLHKTLSFMFKFSGIPDSTIKQLCISIEALLRNKDTDMSTHYRMRMHSIFKAMNN